MKITHVLLGILCTISLYAQVDQVSIGAGYTNQTFYTLQNGPGDSYAHTLWDIAFATAGQDAGVFVNEGVGSSMGAPLPEVELYKAASADFATADTAGMTRLYNDEVSWSAGAFNTEKNGSDPFDFGWGSYDPVTHEVTGKQVFFIKLRNDVFKKLEIQSLITNVFTFRYADLDGSNETVKAVDKTSFNENTLAYFSFDTENTVNIEPAEWDFIFTRYVKPLPDGMGGILNYAVTGVLSNIGVEVAQANGVDPVNISHTDYTDQYTDTIDAIGHDWKTFDIGSFQWIVPLDRAYFVKTAGGDIWKVVFYDFTGASTGVSTLEKTFITKIVSTTETSTHLSSFTVFPNPAQTSASIAFESVSREAEGKIQIFNSTGQLVYTKNTYIQRGLNIKALSFDLPSGMYQLAFSMGEEIIRTPLIIQ